MNLLDRKFFLFPAGALCLGVLVFLPFAVSSYTLRTAAGFAFFLVLAHCFNLLGGNSGYLNLGQGVFVGAGAYGYGFCIQAGIPWSIAVAVCTLGGFLFALIIAPILFRLKGEVFALVNLALLYICLSSAHRLRALTGGADGLFLSTGNDLTMAFYGLILLAVLITVTGRVLPGTRIGYQVEVLGHDVFLAESLGVDTLWVKVRLFALCGAFLTASGAFFMMGEGYIIPATVFGLQTSLMPVAMAMVGGLGKASGPFWGTLAVYGLQEWLWTYVGSMEQTLLGLMLIVAGKRKRIEAFCNRTLNRAG